MLPLEELLKQHSQNNPASFPYRNTNYFAQYVQTKSKLDQEYFRNAGSGLALDGNLYTQHDLEHVNDVIKAAGILLGISQTNITDDVPVNNLSGYEIYALLTGILLHDAGNAFGRTGHEKLPFKILTDANTAGTDAAELRVLAQIAQAHGGRAKDGDKDTIGKVIQQPSHKIQGIPLRSRMIASILRLADELSENPTRANDALLKSPSMSPDAVVHNLYCKVINIDIDVLARTIRKTFEVEVDLIAKKFPIKDAAGARETYLIDYIAERLEKCDLERQYCNRYFSGLLRFDSIRAELKICRNEDVLDTVSLTLDDSGYPQTKKAIKDLNPLFDGLTQYRTHHGTSGAVA